MPSTRKLTGSPADGSTMAFRIELTAMLELLRSHPSGRLLVQSDSTYVIKVFTEWLPKWRKRNMRKADRQTRREPGSPRRNRQVTHRAGHRMAGGKGTVRDPTKTQKPII